MKHRLAILFTVSILMMLGTGCPADAPAGASWSSPPTDAQVIDRMRELAHRDGSQEALRSAGEHALEIDPEGALEDLRAAAAIERSPLSAPDWQATRRVADALTELGAEDEALAIVKRDLLATLTPAGEAPKASYDASAAGTLAEMAEYFWPAEPQLVRRVADELSARLEATGGPQGGIARAHRQIEAAWLRVLALLEPERAWELALAGAEESWQPPGELVRNIGRAGPSDPEAILDEVTRRGVDNTGFGPAAEGISLLAAALLRTNPERAVARITARQWNDTRVPPFDSQLLAAVAVDAGIDRLPEQAEYDAFYAGFIAQIAQIDADAALALKDRISAPEQQARALGAIVWAIADDDTARAWELALEIVQMWQWTPTEYGEALVRAGNSLAAHGGDIMGVIVGRILGHHTAAPVWWRWREFHPDEAEEWMARREEDERCALLANALVHAERDGEVAALLELADRALAAPAPAPRVIALVVRALTRVAPDRAREAWGRLEERPVAGWDLHQHLEALTDLAYALHLREAGSAAPEIAEMERLLAEADPEDKWMMLLRGRLALLYAATDPPRVGAMARPLLEILDWDRRERVWGHNVTPAAAHAVAALMTVDPETAQAALDHHPSIMDETDFMRELIVELAVLDPEAAATLLPVHSRTGRTDFSPLRSRDRVRTVARPEVVRRFAEQWLASAGEAVWRDALNAAGEVSAEALEEAYRANGFSGLVQALQTMASETDTARQRAETEHARAIGDIVNYLLRAERDDLVPLIRELLDEVTGSTAVEQLLVTLSGESLECLPDAALERLMVRLLSRGGDIRDTRALRALGAEVASRDWQIGLSLLSELPPLQQISALRTVRTVPAGEANATGPAAGARN